MRDELLGGERFHSAVEAWVVIGQWFETYNHARPHRGLGMMAPAAFAATQWRSGWQCLPPLTLD